MSAKSKESRRGGIGRWFFVAFFIFGATAASVSMLALLLPGRWIDWIWGVNPEARIGFQQLGRGWAVALMLTVGLGCAGAAVGLARSRPWGRILAIAILVLNLLGDTGNAIFRHDLRTLIGLPIACGMIFYLWRHPFQSAGPPTEIRVLPERN